MIDHRIPKPERIAGYQLHRVVAGMVNGTPVLYADQGDHLVLRTNHPVTLNGKAVYTPETGSVIGFELKACVATRKGGKNIYPDRHDWRSRRAWLESEGEKAGFELLALHVSGDREDVIASNGRKFWIDATQFTGILKVKDSSKFALALAQGIGRVGKAFGLGMLII